jgi:hypothetical protein
MNIVLINPRQWAIALIGLASGMATAFLIN